LRALSKPKLLIVVRQGDYPPDGMTKEKLEALLFPDNDPARIRPPSDWNIVHQKCDLRRDDAGGRFVVP